MDKLALNTSIHNEHKLGIQNQMIRQRLENTDEQKLIQNADTKYQEIFYCKGSTNDRIPDNPNKLTPIDLQKALEDIKNLSLAHISLQNNADVWIVFYNQSNLNSIDILRVDENVWNVCAPVYIEDPRCAFKHTTQLETRRLVDLVKVFFEGEDWYGMANFVFDSQMFEFELQMEGKYE